MSVCAPATSPHRPVVTPLPKDARLADLTLDLQYLLLALSVGEESAPALFSEVRSALRTADELDLLVHRSEAVSLLARLLLFGDPDRNRDLLAPVHALDTPGLQRSLARVRRDLLAVESRGPLALLSSRVRQERRRLRSDVSFLTRRIELEEAQVECPSSLRRLAVLDALAVDALLEAFPPGRRLGLLWGQTERLATALPPGSKAAARLRELSLAAASSA